MFHSLDGFTNSRHAQKDNELRDEPQSVGGGNCIRRSLNAICRANRPSRAKPEGAHLTQTLSEKLSKKVINCRKTTINLKWHGFCGQVQQIVGRSRYAASKQPTP